MKFFDGMCVCFWLCLNNDDDNNSNNNIDESELKDPRRIHHIKRQYNFQMGIIPIRIVYYAMPIWCRVGWVDLPSGAERCVFIGVVTNFMRIVMENSILSRQTRATLTHSPLTFSGACRYTMHAMRFFVRCKLHGHICMWSVYHYSIKLLVK